MLSLHRSRLTLAALSGIPDAITRRGVVFLGLVGALFAGGQGVAQTPQKKIGRLTVRPHEMATGTQNAQAGQQALDSLSKVFVYVPQQCVGARRCPLVVFLHGGGVSSQDEIDAQGPLAEKYGMILLAPEGTGARTVDAALKQVLRKFAIDPDKIAVSGGSVGGGATAFLGRNNLDIFSRVAPMSEVVADYKENDYTGVEPQNDKTQFYVVAGIREGADGLLRILEFTQQERQRGRAAMPVLNLRPHQRRLRDLDAMWRWLQESWATPSYTPRTSPPPSIVDSVSLLTAEALTKMTTFWATFMTGPDSTWTTVRKTQLRPLAMPVGLEKVWVSDMVDIPLLAAKYVSVADALRKAGLTTQQEEGYRIALVSALATMHADSVAKTVPATSVLGKNVAFVSAHREVVNGLEDLIGVPRCEDTDETGAPREGC